MLNPHLPARTGAQHCIPFQAASALEHCHCRGNILQGCSCQAWGDSSFANFLLVFRHMPVLPLQEYKIHNADILMKEDCTVDDLIDVIEVSLWLLPASKVHEDYPPDTGNVLRGPA